MNGSHIPAWRGLRNLWLVATIVICRPCSAAVPASGSHAMVVTEQALATQAGIAVLRHGGNAVDAAVAVGYALAVTDPCCGNIGGGGFMLIHHAGGGDSFINFRERAPLAARPDMYLDAQGKVIPDRSTIGWLAVGVPGTVAGLERARIEYGTMSRWQLVAPALALARDGFILERGDTDELGPRWRSFTKRSNVGAIFAPHGAPLAVGQRLRQPGLARSLAVIARDGARGFYRGPIAKQIVAASRRNGGILTLADFASYTTEELAPVKCRYRQYAIVSAPPPSSGGTTLCQILSIDNGYPFDRYGFASKAAIAHDVEAERLAYADRNTYLGDPDFVTNPVAQLLAPAYIAKLRRSIGDRARRSSEVRGGLSLPEHRQTTHYSIVDGAGNAVAVTYTINDSFGAGVIAGETGFFLNNEMDDFTSKPGVANLYGLVQGRANAIAPGKRPLSSMAPTIVLKQRHVAIVAGSPGGSRIITIVLGVLHAVIDYRMNVADAVAAPRYHHQWLPDVIEVERGAVPPATRAALVRRGYAFVDRDPWGVAAAIVIDPLTGVRYGASDPRRKSGLALGY